jgi:hypothetical protein
MGADRPREVETPERAAAQLLQAGTIAAIAAVAVQTLAHLANEFVFDDRFEGLDADFEGNAFTWASSAAVLAVAFAALLHAVVFRRRRTAFMLVVATATFFSLDDAVQIHEPVALALGEDLLGLPDYAAVRLWLVLYFPLLILMAALLWVVAREAWSAAGRMIRVGLGLLVASIPAELAGAVTRPLADDGTHAPDDIRVAIEEALELGGWIVVAAGVAAAVTVTLMNVRQDYPS